jgi:hypothetical protein
LKQELGCNGDLLAEKGFITVAGYTIFHEHGMVFLTKLPKGQSGE